MKTPAFKRSEFDAKLVARALKDADFKARLKADPKAVYEAELGRKIPGPAKIVVIEERPDTFYVVVPYIPEDLHPGDETIDAVARHILTHREPCWGVGDGLD